MTAPASQASPSLGRAAGSALRWNAAGAAATLLSQFLQMVVLARWLPPAQFGMAATALAIVAFAQGFTDLGLTNALVQRDALDHAIWSSALWAVLCGSIGVALVTAGSAFGFESMLGLPGLIPLVAWAALQLPFAGPTAIFQADLQRHLRFAQLSLAEIFAAVVSLAAALTWAWWRREAMALIVGQVALSAVRGAALCTFSPRKFGSRFRLADLRALRGLAAYGGYQMGERALNSVAGNLDRVLVARLLGAAAAGYYTLASQIALRPLALLSPLVFRTLFPLLSRLQREPGRLADSFLRSTSLLSLLTAGLYTLLFGLSQPLVNLVLGPRWETVGPLLRILVGLGFLWTVTQPLSTVTLALGRARAGFWINVVVLGVNAFGVILGARLGLAGVAWGLLSAATVLLPVDFYLAYRWMGIRPPRFLSAVAWPLLPAGAAAGCLRALGLFSVWNSMPSLVALVLQGAAGLLLWAVFNFAVFPSRVKSAWREVRNQLPAF